jgi:hypothetical protein
MEQDRRDAALAHAAAIEAGEDTSRLDVDLDAAHKDLSDAIDDYYQTVRDYLQRGASAAARPYTYRLLKVADERYLNRGEPLPVDLAARLIELGIDVNNL